jgi:hypothetical protein
VVRDDVLHDAHADGRPLGVVEAARPVAKDHGVERARAVEDGRGAVVARGLGEGQGVGDESVVGLVDGLVVVVETAGPLEEVLWGGSASAAAQGPGALGDCVEDLRLALGGVPEPADVDDDLALLGRGLAELGGVGRAVGRHLVSAARRSPTEREAGDRWTGNARRVYS